MSSPCFHSLKIFNRWKGGEIASVPTHSQSGAIHTLVRSGVSLRNADLRGFVLSRAFLRGADLRGADLTRALMQWTDLRGASLRGADLRHADLGRAVLRDTDLRGANFADADLSDADLRGANLTDAELRSAGVQNVKLEGTVLDWRRGTLPAEILRRSAGSPGGHPRLVLDLLVHGERDDLPWLSIIGRHESAVNWAIGLLAPHVRPGDNAPPFLKRIASELRRPAIRRLGLPGLTWVRRESAR